MQRESERMQKELLDLKKENSKLVIAASKCGFHWLSLLHALSCLDIDPILLSTCR